MLMITQISHACILLTCSLSLLSLLYMQLYIHLAAATKSTVYILITQRAGGSYTSGYMHPQG